MVWLKNIVSFLLIFLKLVLKDFRMGILDLPRYDRPGERLKNYGAGVLSDTELLSILLGKGKNESVIKLSQRLLKDFNLNKLSELKFNELTKECNGDSVAALKILSFIELSKRRNKLISGGYNKKSITSAEDVYNMFKDHVSGLKKERLYCLLLDTKNVVIKTIRISEGTLNSSLIHPREVFKDAIRESANAIILVHNHPTNDATPSDNDLEVTERIVKLSDMIGIRLLDHVIISKKGYDNIPIKYT